MAQKEAFGENIDLEITGSLKDAQVFVRRQTYKDTGICTRPSIFKTDDHFVLFILCSVYLDVLILLLQSQVKK